MGALGTAGQGLQGGRRGAVMGQNRCYTWAVKFPIFLKPVYKYAVDNTHREEGGKKIKPH